MAGEIVRSEPKSKLSKKVAWLLDECIRVPGTNFRFGLDPIIGLIPGGGETVATIIGATVLGEAGRKGIPFSTLIRMGGNMLFNATLGAIPGVGDLFSVWFKSNSRNYKMLKEWQESEDGSEARGGWWPILLIVGILAIVLVINVLVWIFVYGAIYTWLKGAMGQP